MNTWTQTIRHLWIVLFYRLHSFVGCIILVCHLCHLHKCNLQNTIHVKLTCWRREQIAHHLTRFMFSRTISKFSFFFWGEQCEFAVYAEIHMVEPHRYFTTNAYGELDRRAKSLEAIRFTLHVWIQTIICGFKLSFLKLSFWVYFSNFGASVWYILRCKIKYVEWDANLKLIRKSFC